MSHWCSLRYYLLPVLLVAILAGCTGGAPRLPKEGPVVATATVSHTSEVEVFSWWTRGRESAGLDALLKVLAQRQPEIQFVNAAHAGGSDAEARAALVERLQAGAPPDSWQAPVGQAAIASYGSAGYLEPLNFLFEQQGWSQVLPKTLIPLLESNGNVYAVPTAVHRGNILWYNPQVLAAHNVAVPQTQEDLFAALDAFKAAGMEAPLALGEQWTVMHLLETVLLASLGPDAYQGLWTGDTAWDGAEMAQALANFARLLTYANTDNADLTWEQAGKRLVEGQAAFYVMSDWLEPYLKGQGLQPQQDFGWTTFPGTKGAFQFLAEGFVLATEASHRAEGVAWLEAVGSREGQQAFNLAGGAMPARLDVDRAPFDVYWQLAMDDWATGKVVGSLVHGVVARDDWRSEIEAALTQYLASSDLASFQQGLAAACEEAGPCS